MTLEPAVAPAFEAVRAAVEEDWRRADGGGAARGGSTRRCGERYEVVLPAERAVRRLLRLVGLLLALAGPAAPHALQPGFLDLKALGGDAWRVYWKVPTAGAGPLPIEAVLPESCAPRRPEELRFDGAAFVAEWVARCPGGLEGGEIRIEGLERTATDVLVRYELAPGKAESQRLTAATTGFTVPAPQGRMGVLSRPTSRSGSIISCGGSTT